MAEKREILFVDFDGTLTRRDSLFMFLRHLRRFRGRRSGLNVRMMAVCAGCVLRLISSGEAKRRLLSIAAKGMSHDDFDRACMSFADELDAVANDELLSDLRRHAKGGAEVVVVSASMSCWLRPWMERNADAITDLISTEVEVCGNPIESVRLTTPNCYGAQKVVRINSWLAERHPDAVRDEFRIVAYGDSRGDREMLAMADEAKWVKQ